MHCLEVNPIFKLKRTGKSAPKFVPNKSSHDERQFKELIYFYLFYLNEEHQRISSK